MADTKWSQFPSASDAYADDEVVGLKNGQNSRFSFAKILTLIRQNLSGFFISTSAKGAANGVASLDNTGNVPSSQLPPISSTAADVTYDNTQSGLTADDVQDAIDELAQGGGGGGTTVIANPSGAATDTLTKLQVANTIYSVSGGGAQPKKYLFVGDSYSTLSSNWVDFCAQYLGLSASQYVNAGVSGTGFIVDRNGNIGSAYNGFLDCIQAVTADRETYTDVVICGGINDAQYDTYQSFLGDHIKATITYIKTNFPNAIPHIGFIGGALETSSVLYGRTLPRRKIALYGYITAAIPYYLNGVENAIHQSAYCYGSDGLHPNATGSELIGMAVAQAIQNGAAEVYQANPLNLSYPSPWTITGEDVTLTVHNDTAQLNFNTANMIFNAGTSQNAQTYTRTTGLVMTLPNNLKVNRRYSVQCGIQLRNANNTWTLVYGEFVLEGSTLTMFPVVLSGSGFQSVTTSLFAFVTDLVFNLRTEDIN